MSQARRSQACLSDAAQTLEGYHLVKSPMFWLQGELSLVSGRGASDLPRSWVNAEPPPTLVKDVGSDGGRALRRLHIVL